MTSKKRSCTICPEEIEQAPRARARKPEEVWENVVPKAEAPHHRVKTVWEPEEVKAGDQAKASAGVSAKD